MKPIAFIAVMAVLTGCEALDPAAPGTTDGDTARPSSEVAQLLLTRQQLCGLEAEEQRQAMENRKTRSDKRAQLELVLLASCRPEQTPGLLRRELGLLDEHPEDSLEIRALIQLIRDQSRAYSLLEKQNRQLREELAATIDGIRAIESDMETLRANELSP